MRAPKVQASHLSTFIGNRGSAGYVDDWERNAVLLSEPHFKRKGVWSGGGPFYCIKRSVSHGPSIDVPIQIGFGPPYFIDDLYTVKGVAGIEPHKPFDLEVSELAQLEADKSAARAKRALGYNRTRPGQPVADFAQFWGEIRSLPKIPLGNLSKIFGKVLRNELVPYKGASPPPWWLTTNPAQLAKAIVKDFKNLGSEYLNVVYGWKPFLSDLRKMFYLWQNMDARLAQLVRENGKNIQRKATLAQERDVTQSVTDYPYPYANVLGAPPTYMGGTTKYTVTRYTQEDIWYSAGYRYFVPDIGSSEWTARAKLALFSVNVTPATLWELMPWSWLIDWFSNVGVVMQNSFSPNAVYNLTTNYAYTMRHKVEWVECNAHVIHGPSTAYYKWPAVNHRFVSTSRLETKVRLGGENPYGLDVSITDLTPYQLSILGALGISREKFLK